MTRVKIGCTRTSYATQSVSIKLTLNQEEKQKAENVEIIILARPVFIGEWNFFPSFCQLEQCFIDKIRVTLGSWGATNLVSNGDDLSTTPHSPSR